MKCVIVVLALLVLVNLADAGTINEQKRGLINLNLGGKGPLISIDLNSKGLLHANIDLSLLGINLQVCADVLNADQCMNLTGIQESCKRAETDAYILKLVLPRLSAEICGKTPAELPPYVDKVKEYVSAFASSVAAAIQMASTLKSNDNALISLNVNFKTAYGAIMDFLNDYVSKLTILNLQQSLPQLIHALDTILLMLIEMCATINLIADKASKNQNKIISATVALSSDEVKKEIEKIRNDSESLRKIDVFSK